MGGTFEYRPGALLDWGNQNLVPARLPDGINRR